jgi:hypothetical protein
MHKLLNNQQSINHFNWSFDIIVYPNIAIKHIVKLKSIICNIYFLYLHKPHINVAMIAIQGSVTMNIIYAISGERINRQL